MFQALILDPTEKTEDDLVHKFLNGLKPRIQIFTRPHHPKTLDEAMTIADDIEASHYNINRHGGNQARSGYGAKGKDVDTMRIGAVGLSPSEKQRVIVQGLCFKCLKPGHNAAECKNKSTGGKTKQKGKSRGKGKRPSSGN